MSTDTLTSVRTPTSDRAASPIDLVSTPRLRTGGARGAGSVSAVVSSTAVVSGTAVGSSVATAPGRPVRMVLTARGRGVVRLLALAIATAVLAMGLVLAWVVLAATVAPGASAGDGAAGVVGGAGKDAGPGAGGTIAVVVAPGDTLWQLAREHAPDRDPRAVVTDIVALNDLGSSDVQAGAEVLVPLG